jgi:hypothetical protein
MFFLFGNGGDVRGVKEIGFISLIYFFDGFLRSVL